MKRAALRLIYIVAYHSGLIDVFYFLNRRRQVVITYHNVLPDALFDNTLHLGVSHCASAFARQIEIVNARWPASRSRPDACLITLDDGYRNHHEVAAGILERYGRRGVFFATLALVDGGATLWPDRMLMWLSYVPNGTYRLLGQSFSIANPAGRASCWSALWHRVCDDYGLRSDVLRDMNEVYPFDALAVDEDIKSLRFGAMSAEDIADLVRRGHRVGCHSYNHDILSRLSDAELSEDFARCDAAVGRIYSCDLFSYPFGGSNEVAEREWAACRNSRFRRAFMNVDDVQAGGDAASYAMPRISLPNTADSYVIEAKLSGFEKFLKASIGQRA